MTIPSTQGNKDISDEDFKKRVKDEKRWFTKNFGGDTSIQALGDYYDQSKKKKFTTEKVIVLQVSTSADRYEAKKKALAKRIRDNRKRWKQTQMIYTVEDNAYLYPRKSFVPHDKSKEIILR